MTVSPTTLDKFKGAIVGCAVGDALGAPLEGMPAAAIRAEYGRVTGFIDERFGAGRVTDDTQMTVALAQAIIEMGRFKVEHTALKFGHWMELSDNGVKEARGVGLACATACRRLYQGTGPEESGVPSAGCGAAMRASPVGLRYYFDRETLRDAAVAQAMLTHTDPEAHAGAAAVAFSIAAGIGDEGNLDTLSFIDDTAAFVSPIDEGMSEKIAGLTGYLDAGVDEGFTYTGNGGYVMETVPGALLAFLLSPYDFEGTVVTAVNAGGDSDSLGAIAGAISGAFNGVGRIPERFRKDVEGVEYLESLAFRLFTLTPAYKPPKEPLL